MCLRSCRRLIFLVLRFLTPCSEYAAHSSRDSQCRKACKRKMDKTSEGTSCSSWLSTSTLADNERFGMTMPSLIDQKVTIDRDSDVFCTPEIETVVQGPEQLQILRGHFNIDTRNLVGTGEQADINNASLQINGTSHHDNVRHLILMLRPSRSSKALKQEREDQEVAIDGESGVSEYKIRPIVSKRSTQQRILRGQFIVDTRNLIGSGGQADIHRTSLQVFGQVAVKLMKQQYRNDSLREMLLRKLEPNPYIVQLYGFVYNNTNDQHPTGYIMECLDISLDKVIYDRVLSKYTMNQAFTIIKKICSGIYHLHRCGIMHRDIKPANILVSRDLKYVKICDWESGQIINDASRDHPQVQLSEGERTATISGGVGTYGYMAPEVMAKEPDTGPLYTEKCDVYSLAITAWEILSKRKPYSGSMRQIEKLVMANVRPDLDALPLGGIVHSLFQRAWRHDPNERPSMMEINSKLLFEREDEISWHRTMCYSNGTYNYDALEKYIDGSVGPTLFHWSEEAAYVLVDSILLPVFGQVACKYVSSKMLRFANLRIDEGAESAPAYCEDIWILELSAS